MEPNLSEIPRFFEVLNPENHKEIRFSFLPENKNDPTKEGKEVNVSPELMKSVKVTGYKAFPAAFARPTIFRNLGFWKIKTHPAGLLENGRRASCGTPSEKFARNHLTDPSAFFRRTVLSKREDQNSKSSYLEITFFIWR